MLPYEELDINGKLVRNLWKVSHVLRDTSDGRGSQQRILTVLLRSGKVTQAELTEYLGIRPASASEVLAKMESAGWIHREKNALDRRTIDIELTDRGRAEAAVVNGQREQLRKAMFANFTQAEKEVFLAFLEKLTMDWQMRFGENAERGEQKR